MKLKRILLISYHTCPLASEEGKETGGMNIYVYELASHLAKNGYIVDVITRLQDTNSKVIVEVEKNFRVIHLVAGPKIAVAKTKLPDFMPEFIRSFAAFIKIENTSYDLLHAHYYQSGLIGLEIKKELFAKIPLIMTFHTLALMKILVARSAAELDPQSRIDAEFLLTKAVDAIITPSTNDAEYLQYLYEVPKHKIFKIPPGVNTELFKPIDRQEAKKHLGFTEKEKIILFVGRIEPLKGIDMLLYAIKILKQQIPDVPFRLLIVGGDVSQHITKWSRELRTLERIRRMLHLTNEVDFVGQKSQHQLQYYYNAAEIVVMPSHYESFGMAAAEAMATGTPVITTNVSGISYLIDDLRSTLITSVNNPLLLASQIKELLTDKKMMSEIEEKSLRNVADLSWTEIVKKVEKVYEKFLRF